MCHVILRTVVTPPVAYWYILITTPTCPINDPNMQIVVGVYNQTRLPLIISLNI